jgi:hypothetical protein
VTIEGSFHNLVANSDSVSVFVFHNDVGLFEADGNDIDGSDGDPTTLSEADGTFRIDKLSVAVGDTIDFVVDPNGNFFGDETAVRARIVPEPSAGALAASALGTLYVIVGRRTRRAPSLGVGA